MAPCMKCGSYLGTYIDFQRGEVYASGVVTALPRWGTREAVIATEALLTATASHHTTADGAKHARLHPIEAALSVPRWIVDAGSLADLNQRFQQVMWRIDQAFKPFGYSCSKASPHSMSIAVRPVTAETPSTIILSPQIAREAMETARDALAAGKYDQAHEAARHALDHHDQYVQALLLIALMASTGKISISRLEAVRTAECLQAHHKAVCLMIDVLPFYRRRARKSAHKMEIDSYLEILGNHEDDLGPGMSWANTVL